METYQKLFLYIFYTIDGGLHKNLAENILGQLNYHSLKSAEQVSDDWHQVVVSGNLYRKIFENNASIFLN